MRNIALLLSVMLLIPPASAVKYLRECCDAISHLHSPQRDALQCSAVQCYLLSAGRNNVLGTAKTEQSRMMQGHDGIGRNIRLNVSR